MKASEQWLEEYKKEHADRVHDPVEQRRDSDGPVIEYARWTFDVLPPTFNECMRLWAYRRADYYAKINAWDERFSVCAHQKAGAGAHLAVPLHVHMVRRSSEEPDLDGLYGSFKVPLDALVNAALIPDDDPSSIAKLSAEHERAEEPSVTFTFTAKEP